MLVGGVWVLTAVSAQAGIRHLSGSAQFYIGGGLPIPIRPDGAPGAWVGPGGTPPVHTQGIYGIPNAKNAVITTLGVGPDKTIRLKPSQFTMRNGMGAVGVGMGGGPKAVGTGFGAQVVGVKTQNPVALQVYTNFTVQVPGSTATIKPGSGAVLFGGSGRTGPNVLSWCPVNGAATAVKSAAANPGCIWNVAHGNISLHKCPKLMGVMTVGPSCGATTQPKSAYNVRGHIRYQRTAKVLGGPQKGTLQGYFDVAVGLGQGVGLFVKGKPPPTAEFGATLGDLHQQNVGKGPTRAGISTTGVGGLIKNPGVLGAAKALSNRTIFTFGAPNTAGNITIVHSTGSPNSPESYTLMGYDNRTGAMGSGVIQLVSGSLGNRSLSGPNANRGMVRMVVPEPAAIAGGLGALLVLAGCHRFARRRSK